MPYYRQAHAVCYLYDVTSSSSFEHVHEWVSAFEEDWKYHNKTSPSDADKVLIGTKIDRAGDRVCTDGYAYIYIHIYTPSSLRIVHINCYAITRTFPLPPSIPLPSPLGCRV